MPQPTERPDLKEKWKQERQEILEKIPVTEVVKALGIEISRTKKPYIFKAIFPYHQKAKSPSLKIDLERKTCFCYFCWQDKQKDETKVGMLGNIFSIVMVSKGIQFKEAVKYLKNSFAYYLTGEKNILYSKKQQQR